MKSRKQWTKEFVLLSLRGFESNGRSLEAVVCTVQELFRQEFAELKLLFDTEAEGEAAVPDITRVEVRTSLHRMRIAGRVKCQKTEGGTYLWRLD